MVFELQRTRSSVFFLHAGLCIKILFIVCLFCFEVFSAEIDTEKTSKKIQLKSNRPDDQPGLTKVHFFIFVVDIDDIDGAGQNFTANVYISLRWKDERLAHDDEVHLLPLEEIWNPRVLLVNRAGIVQKSLPEVAEVKADGTVTYHQRYSGPLSQPLKLSKFPFDQHEFTIRFVTVGYSPDKIEFVPDTSFAESITPGGAIYHDLSLPDWKVLKYHAEASVYEPVKNRKVAGVIFQFSAKRYTVYYIWQVIVPLILIVMMSWGVFYINPTNGGAQIGVATSSMLTLIAYRFMLGNLIPRLPYMTRLDYFTLGSTVLVFLTLAEVIITTNLALGAREKLALKIDHWFRFVFPTVFILWSLWSLVL